MNETRDVSYSSQPTQFTEESCPFPGGAVKALRLVNIFRLCTFGKSERMASARCDWLIPARIVFLHPIGTRLIMGGGYSHEGKAQHYLKQPGSDDRRH